MSEQTTPSIVTTDTDSRQIDHNGSIRAAYMTAEELAVHLPSYGMKRDGQGRYTPVLNGAYVTTDADGQQPLRLEVR